MSTIKQQVLKEFPEATLEKLTPARYYVTEKSIGCSVTTNNAEEAWTDFKNRYCKKLPQLPMDYKELVLERFHDARIIPTDHKWFVSIETNDFRNKEDAWKSFYEQYCTDKPDLIIGKEYEFSNDNFLDIEPIEKGKLASYSAFIEGKFRLFRHIRPIQNNPKLDQLKQLAEELDFDLVPKNK
jgi:hypothetical protein